MDETETESLSLSKSLLDTMNESQNYPKATKFTEVIRAVMRKELLQTQLEFASHHSPPPSPKTTDIGGPEYLN
jgi:hypothetical protein